MGLPDWQAAGLPYNPIAWNVDQSGRGNLESPMQGGAIRQRRQNTVDIATVSLGIRMSFAQFEAFKAFHETTLGNGSSRFTMPVWNGRAWPVRIVQITDGGRYKTARLATEMVLSLQLDVWGF